ncbi:MAG TPA: PQQ-binding-like beta-propeller repeat protein [Thermomicrobiales bacterium]|nr:PQQ-binding-like beta-propeller repeat protein [Thermomicrobiales bacterium]
MRRPGLLCSICCALALALAGCGGATPTPVPAATAPSAAPTAAPAPAAPAAPTATTAAGAAAAPTAATAGPTATVPGTATATAAPSATDGSPPASPAAGGRQGDWLRFGYDPARSGVNPEPQPFGQDTVGQFRRRWAVKLPAVADSSPALLRGVPTASGVKDVLYVTTRDGRLLALDAAGGKLLWSKQPRGPKITHSSPAVDPDRQVVYAYGLDGALHQYRAATGDEITGDGWPVRITTMTQTEKESSSLNIADGKVYVTTSGYLGDAPPYQGHVVVVDEATGAAQVFNSLCADQHRLLASGDCKAQQSGIWARAGAVVDPATGDIYATTGNGDFDPAAHDYGDTVLRLSPDGAHLLDSYTPADYQRLGEGDVDLGSTDPALLPRIPKSKTPLLLVQGGKDGVLRLLNRENMSGQGGPGHVGGEVQQVEAKGCETFTQPVVWTAPDGTLWVFVAGECGLDGYRVLTDANGATRLSLAWNLSGKGTTPVLAGGVLFLATSGAVLAVNPTTGARLWTSAGPAAGGTIGDIHWQSVIVSGGVLYVADEDGMFYAYGP